ncbi:TBC1 domain family member 24-like [Erpetoichthys calabaricus]|uniref:TBC1 domain family member 24-like n=1 Tax=Erpetoichthys calabaricus TaxID=27687 RepID=UPI002234B6A4|nr:TBC1 domain family member 24-like [Erpetoichthys calabaricus]
MLRTPVTLPGSSVAHSATVTTRFTSGSWGSNSEDNSTMPLIPTDLLDTSTLQVPRQTSESLDPGTDGVIRSDETTTLLGSSTGLAAYCIPQITITESCSDADPRCSSEAPEETGTSPNIESNFSEGSPGIIAVTETPSPMRARSSSVSGWAKRLGERAASILHVQSDCTGTTSAHSSHNDSPGHMRPRSNSTTGWAKRIGEKAASILHPHSDNSGSSVSKTTNNNSSSVTDSRSHCESHGRDSDMTKHSEDLTTLNSPTKHRGSSTQYLEVAESPGPMRPRSHSASGWAKRLGERAASLLHHHSDPSGPSVQHSTATENIEPMRPRSHSERFGASAGWAKRMGERAASGSDGGLSTWSRSIFEGESAALCRSSECKQLDIIPSAQRHAINISIDTAWEISTSPSMENGLFVDWDKLETSSNNSGDENLPLDPKLLKRMARSGAWSNNHGLRRKAYNYIIGRILCRTMTPDATVYHDIASKLFGEKSVSTHPFPEFVEGSLIPMYCLNQRGLNAVKKILLCIENQFPDITYCPVLPAIVALLLHYSESEEECFQNVCRLIACNDPKKRFIDQTFLAFASSCMTFGDLVNKYCQPVHKLIASTDHNRFTVYSEWMVWLFGGLPFEYAIRVCDVYLLEGYKVLYRVALALLKQYRVSVTFREAEITDIQQDIQIFMTKIGEYLTVEKLLEKAFSIRLLSRKDIKLLQEANRKALTDKGISVSQRRHSMYIAVDLQQFHSSIVTAQEMRMVWSWIPERFALFHPTMVFQTCEHGYSLQSFYLHCDGYEPTILLLKTVDGDVCGAFLSSDWAERHKTNAKGANFFGTGESFVFTLRPEMERYEWVSVQNPKVTEDVAPCPRRRAHSFSPGFSTSASSRQPPASGLSRDMNHLSFPTEKPADMPSKTNTFFMSGSKDGIIIGGGEGQALFIDQDLHHGHTERSDTFNNPPLCKENFQIQLLEVWSVDNTP